MANKCAREECGKTVYPLEELKCLDKIWHKQCFKCHSCGMILSMKTYKGFEKNPYCQAHYPKILPTAVTQTPEMATAKANTEFQSQVQYHSQYEKNKGQKIQIADDPELKRCMQNTKIQSQAEYHKEQEKKKQQDSTRPQQDLSSNESLQIVSSSPNENIYSENERKSSNTPNLEAAYAYGTPLNSDSPYSQRIISQAAGTVIYNSDLGGRVQPTEQRKIGTIADYNPNESTPVNENGKAAAQKQTDSQQKSKAVQQSQSQASPNKNTGGFVVRALYDYSAADKDEVSFTENDIIVNCQMVDEGWMTGTVQRTLMWGMLPANYVEKVNQPKGQYKIK